MSLNMTSESYNREFYEGLNRNNGQSAMYLAEYLIKRLNFTSAIDIGCGNGDLLKSFLNLGIKKLKGIEGNRNFILQDDQFDVSIENLESQILFHKKYDIAICLEVAEHLDASFADNLISTLTNASDLIVFSAAVPGQGGTNHVNEQPPNYWALKFLAQGYTLIMDPREEIWNHQGIAPYYRQNILVYKKSSNPPLTYVEPKYRKHPDIFLNPLRKIQFLAFRILRKVKSRI
jgi:hypothetical protein